MKQILGILYVTAFAIAPIAIATLVARKLSVTRPVLAIPKNKIMSIVGIAFALYLVEFALFMRFLSCMDGCN